MPGTQANIGSGPWRQQVSMAESPSNDYESHIYVVVSFDRQRKGIEMRIGG